jgi:hypothetical protein
VAEPAEAKRKQGRSAPKDPGGGIAAKRARATCHARGDRRAGGFTTSPPPDPSARYAVLAPLERVAPPLDDSANRSAFTAGDDASSMKKMPFQRPHRATRRVLRDAPYETHAMTTRETTLRETSMFTRVPRTARIASMRTRCRTQ